jgi:uridine kinase
LNIPWVVSISQDSFYKSLNEEQLKTVSEYNFDHPNALDWEAMVDAILKLKQGKSVEIPVYDFKTHTRFLPL